MVDQEPSWLKRRFVSGEHPVTAGAWTARMVHDAKGHVSRCKLSCKYSSTKTAVSAVKLDSEAQKDLVNAVSKCARLGCYKFDVYTRFHPLDHLTMSFL